MADTQPKQTFRNIEDLDPVIRRFRGQIPQLESAIGAYVAGRRFGWKVLYLAHEKRTIRKYEDILGIRFRDELPAEGDLAEKSAAFRLSRRVSNFWKAVSGEIKVKVGGKERPVRDARIDQGKD